LPVLSKIGLLAVSRTERHLDIWRLDCLFRIRWGGLFFQIGLRGLSGHGKERNEDGDEEVRVG